MIVRCYQCGIEADYWSGRLTKVEGRRFVCRDLDFSACLQRQRERRHQRQRGRSPRDVRSSR